MGAAEEMAGLTNNDDKYYIMHKNIKCAELKIINNECTYFTVLNKDELPPYLQIKHCPKYEVYNWIDSRVVLPNRDMYDRLKIMILDSNYTRIQWALDNHCLSLSDCYWVKGYNEELSWENINYYDNDFSNDLNDILIDSKISNDNKYKKLVCPGSTVTASLPKTWVLKDNKRLLYKRGNQEIINEVLCSNLLDGVTSNYVKYWQDELYSKQCSVCETMSNNNVELITAYELTHGWKKSNSPVKQYIDELKDKIPNFIKDFSIMNMLDYIAANCDRHWNNFGIIRNPNTLEYISLAPIYDSGDTFWYNSPVIGCNVKSLLYNSTRLEYCDTSYIDKNTWLNAWERAYSITDLYRFKNDFELIDTCVKDRINKVFIK